MTPPFARAPHARTEPGSAVHWRSRNPGPANVETAIHPATVETPEFGHLVKHVLARSAVSINRQINSWNHVARRRSGTLEFTSPQTETTAYGEGCCPNLSAD